MRVMPRQLSTTFLPLKSSPGARASEKLLSYLLTQQTGVKGEPRGWHYARLGAGASVDKQARIPDLRGLHPERGLR